MVVTVPGTVGALAKLTLAWKRIATRRRLTTMDIDELHQVEPVVAFVAASKVRAHYERFDLIITPDWVGWTLTNGIDGPT